MYIEVEVIDELWRYSSLVRRREQRSVDIMSSSHYGNKFNDETSILKARKTSWQHCIPR